MKKIYRSFYALLLLALSVTAGYAAVENRQADLVLGQNDFTHNGQNIIKDSGLSQPNGVTTDPATGRVYVAEYSNHRVLWWNSAASLINGESADGVLGQPDFASNSNATTQTGMWFPYAVTVDTASNVWVADSGNNRVLKYTNPTTNGQAASVVLGQTNFTSKVWSPTGPSSLYSPGGVCVSTTGAVWVSDSSNNRVLKFGVPISSGMAASIVLGQKDFTSSGGATTSTGTWHPYGVGLDSAGNVWVADYLNNRILKYMAPISSGMAATVVLGQSVFTTKDSTCSPTGLHSPIGLDVDGTDNVWVADYQNSRILKYATPITTNKSASMVLGQPDFYSKTLTCSSSGLVMPYGVNVDGSWNVWVADSYNNRVLKFNAPTLATGELADLVLGQSNFVTGATNMTCSKGFNFSGSYGGVDATTDRVYVCDTQNNRVLWWNNPTSLTNGKQADGVLGQPDFFSYTSTCTQSGLGTAQGVCVDSSGNVWVVDSSNYRILKYMKPTANGQAANLVLGQADFTSRVSSCTQTTIGYPQAIKVDSSGNVWIIDTGNKRVLKYSNPTTNGQAASLVLGQPDFNSNTGGCTQTSMENPVDLVVDSLGNLWVVEEFNHRVLKFSNPSASGQAASLVLGQTAFDTRTAACSQTELSSPAGLGVDGLDNIWVTDKGNNRVLKFTNPTTSGQAASSVLGQTDFNSALMPNPPTQTGMANPTRLSVDNSGSVWILDGANNRLIKFNGVQTHSSSNLVDPGSSTEITINPWSGEIKVNIPAGTFGQAVNVVLSTSPVPSSDRSTIKVGNICIEITNNLNLQPLKPITITMHYLDSSFAGLDESKLVICRYDEVHNLWTPLPSTVDTANNVVTAITNHLSKFVLVQLAPAADLGSVKVFPNPLNSKLYSLTIVNLTASADIKIYNVTGELIRKLDYLNGTGVTTWDGKNDSGSSVASGVYIIYIKSDSGTKKIKVAVEK